MLEARIGEPVLQSAIVGEQHQALTVMIKPAARIDIFYGNEIRKALSVAGKLAEHSIRLMKQDVAEGHPSDYLREERVRSTMGADTRWRCPGQDCAALPGFTCACAHALYPDRMRSYHGHEPACCPFSPMLRTSKPRNKGQHSRPISMIAKSGRDPDKNVKTSNVKTRELPIGNPPEFFSLAKIWQQSCGGS